MSKLDHAIATLNNLEVGSLDQIRGRIDEVRAALESEGLSELVDKLEACQHALLRGELDEFRRLRETVVSRLGHHRVRTG